MPCLGEDQIRALHVGRSKLHWTWSANGVFGRPDHRRPPRVRRGSLLGRPGRAATSSGRVVQRIHAGDLTHFPSSVVDGGYVFVPTLTGITAFRG